jgi:hypothetical protein
VKKLAISRHPTMPEPLSMLDAGPPILPMSPYLSNYIRPTFNHGLHIWWALFWPTTLISAILAAAIEFGLLRLIYEHRNVPGNLIAPLVWSIPYVISYAVAFFIMEYILHKNFRQFRIGLVSSGSKFTSQAFPATLARTVRVWWTYSWRSVVWRLVIFSSLQFRLACCSDFSRERRWHKMLYGY